jgi:hypothetical protein
MGFSACQGFLKVEIARARFNETGMQKIFRRTILTWPWPGFMQHWLGITTTGPGNHRKMEARLRETAEFY